MSVQIKLHALIEFLAAENVPPIEIRRQMKVVFGDFSVDISVVQLAALCTHM
jgi:hypothetical protein